MTSAAEGLAEPARRRKPSMPHVTMEMPKAPERRTVVEENVHVGAGVDKSKEKRIRTLTLVEKMHRQGMMPFAPWQTAGALRNAILLEIGPSQGVSSYSNSPGEPDRYGKADRRARAILRNRSNLAVLADLLFSMVGVVDQDGTKTFDHKLAEKLIAACISTVNAPTQGEIGAEFTPYVGTKQTAAAGGVLLVHILTRGAVHLRYECQQEFTDFSARRLALGAGSMIK